MRVTPNRARPIGEGSITRRLQGNHRLTPLYDVLSAYLVLGESPGKLSSFKAKMPMAVRVINPHWKMREILRRHWLAMGTRHGNITEDGRSAQFVVDALVH